MIYSWLLTVTTKYNIEKGPIFDTLLILILAQVFTVRAPHGTSTVTAVRGLSPNARHNEARQASFVTTTSTPSIAMTAYKHPIAHHWIKQTLVPFLLFAFASMLPYPAEENSYYRHQNRKYEQAQLQRQQQSLYTSTKLSQMTEPQYTLLGKRYNHMTSVREPPYSQQKQNVPQQSGVPSVYAPLQTLHQTPSIPQMNATAQNQQQIRVT
jgi:hypothetical protein